MKSDAVASASREASRELQAEQAEVAAERQRLDQQRAEGRQEQELIESARKAAAREEDRGRNVDTYA